MKATPVRVGPLVSAVLMVAGFCAAAAEGAGPAAAPVGGPSTSTDATAVGTNAAAAATNATTITSRRMDYDAQKRTAVFDGNVVVADPRVRITADNITASFTTNNQPETITAVGNVRIEQTNRIAVCGSATYSVASGKLVLLGKPKVWRGPDVLSGSRIVFNRDTDQMICDDASLILVAPGDSVENLLK